MKERFNTDLYIDDGAVFPARVINFTKYYIMLVIYIHTQMNPGCEDYKAESDVKYPVMELTLLGKQTDLYNR